MTLFLSLFSLVTFKQNGRWNLRVYQPDPVSAVPPKCLGWLLSPAGRGWRKCLSLVRPKQ